MADCWVPSPPAVRPFTQRAPCPAAALYLRLVTNRHFASLALALGASIAGFAASGASAVRAAVPLLGSGELHFSHLMQRIVICHIIVHECSDRGLSMTQAARAAASATTEAVRNARVAVASRVESVRVGWRQRRLPVADEPRRGPLHARGLQQQSYAPQRVGRVPDLGGVRSCL